MSIFATRVITGEVMPENSVEIMEDLLKFLVGGVLGAISGRLVKNKSDDGKSKPMG